VVFDLELPQCSRRSDFNQIYKDTDRVASRKMRRPTKKAPSPRRFTAHQQAGVYVIAQLPRNCPQRYHDYVIEKSHPDHRAV
jgi:hypothetical protein